jgi:cytochrome P450
MYQMAVLFTQTPESSGTLTFEELVDTLSEGVLGPIFGSAATLTWPLIMLATHPAKQQHLRSLLTASFGNKAPTVQDVQNTRVAYLDNVIKECARLHPVFTMSVPEIVSTPTEILGYAVPKGTNVMVDVYSLNHNPAVWDDPHKFVPERFEHKTPSYALHGFGLGNRKCLGMFYVNVVQKMLLVSILQKYTISCVDSSTLVQESNEIVQHMEPGNPFRIKRHPFIFVPDVLLSFSQL